MFCTRIPARKYTVSTTASPGNGVVVSLTAPQRRLKFTLSTIWSGRLWLRRVEPASRYRKVAGSIPPHLYVKVSSGKVLNPKTAPDVLVGILHGSHRHQCLNVCMNYCKSLWTNVSAECKWSICYPQAPFCEYKHIQQPLYPHIWQTAWWCH